MNPQVKVWRFYKAIPEHVLSGWSTVEAFIILDGVMMFGVRWQIFRVSLQHGHRAIPLAWTVVEGTGIANQIACRARLREYDRRMSIEQSFRDDKSGGFDMEHTRLQHAGRIDHLLLDIAIATLWCHELGEFVLKQGDALRCQVDPAHERTLSLFQLGLRWLKRTLATGLLLLPDFKAFLSNLKLKPVTIPVAQNSNV